MNNSNSELKVAFQAEIDNFPSNQVEYIDTIFPDLNGMIRGKRLPRTMLSNLGRGIYMPVSLLAMDVLGDVVDSTLMGQQTGELDKRCVPILNTLKPSADDPNKIAQVMLTMLEDDDQPINVEPRNLLANLWQQLKDRGVRPVIALEYEFYLVDNQLTPSGHLIPPISPRSKRRENSRQTYSLDGLIDYSDFLNDIIDMAHIQGIPTAGALTEAAPGQFEINLNHSDDVLTACDHAIMLKRLIKQVALKHDMQATFMAKPHGDEAGSGLHVHISLLDQDDNNLMKVDAGEPNALMQNVLAGMLEMMPECVSLLAPNMNSYRRYQPGLYVPIKAAWGFNNRTVALRIPPSDAKNLRIEYRLAGADANPYLAASCLLASVLHGLESKGTPSAPIVGNGFVQAGAPLPIYQSQALKILKSAQLLPRYFNEKFLHIYYECKHDELLRFKKYVTSLEIKWLLEHV